MIGCIFNIDGGYLEGLCRGFKCGILKQADYLNLVQCETLEGEKIRTVVMISHTINRLTN
jgi:V-type H+-transporting ATPase subunit d